MHADELVVDDETVRRLVAAQFPQWSALSVRRLPPVGTDNQLFRLGDDLLVRMPRIPGPAATVAFEHTWLPRLAPHLPVAIPAPVAMGEPGDDFPWPWTVVPWIEGTTPDRVVVRPGGVGGRARRLRPGLPRRAGDGRSGEDRGAGSTAAGTRRVGAGVDRPGRPRSGLPRRGARGVGGRPGGAVVRRRAALVPRRPPRRQPDRAGRPARRGDRLGCRRPRRPGDRAQRDVGLRPAVRGRALPRRPSAWTRLPTAALAASRSPRPSAAGPTTATPRPRRPEGRSRRCGD